MRNQMFKKRVLFYTSADFSNIHIELMSGFSGLVLKSVL